MKNLKLKYSKAVLVIVSVSFMLASCSKTSVQPLPTAVQTSGTVTTFAGSSGVNGSTNGTGTAASFFYPQGLAFDNNGNLLVADQGNNEIRKITSAGAVSILEGTLVAGNTNTSATPGTAALFNGPTGVAVDALNNVYVADFGNNEIRKIASTGGVVTTFAGATKAGNTNATGTAASFNGPAGVAVDALGNVYVADFNNNLIREISPAGVVTTLAGSGSAGNANGTGTAASFNGPRAVAVDANFNVYVADAKNNLIREITQAGVVTTLAGTGAAGNTSGAAASATFNYPSGIAVDGSGNVFVADANNNLLREISSGTVTSIAGSGYLLLNGTFNAPTGVATNVVNNAPGSGVVFVANTNGSLIQKVTF